VPKHEKTPMSILARLPSDFQYVAGSPEANSSDVTGSLDIGVFFFFYGSPTRRRLVGKVSPPYRAPHHGSRVEEGELLLASHRSVIIIETYTYSDLALALIGVRYFGATKHSWQKHWVIIKTPAHRTRVYTVDESGTDVMITIFCDFCQFSAKKMAFVSKTNVMITIFAKTNGSLSIKRKKFSLNFSAKIF
jgi:hypothetical protein